MHGIDVHKLLGECTVHGIDVHKLVGEERGIYDYIFNYVCVWIQLILLKTENNKKNNFFNCLLLFNTIHGQ